jgi:hypothetical protein
MELEKQKVFKSSESGEILIPYSSSVQHKSIIIIDSG